MELKTFTKFINKIKKVGARTSDLYDLNVDLINFTDDFYNVITLLLEEIYNESQIDILEWWLYEDVEKHVLDEKGKMTNDLTKIEDLFNYINTFKN
jgi:hypothetical protein